MKTGFFRKRNNYLYSAGLLVLVLYFLTDPYFGLIQHLPVGGGTVATILILLKGLLYVSLLHFTRKFIFDYNEADFQKLALKGAETSVGAAVTLVGFSIMMIAFAIVIYAATIG